MKVALLLVALVGAASAVPSRQQRIVGGEPTAIERYNFNMQMEFQYFGFMWSQACGGAALTCVSILSAAHCYEGDSAGQWRVRVGSIERNSGGFVHSVSRMILHEGFHSSHFNNDVAIVRLGSPVNLGPLVGTAIIAGSNYNLQDNTYITAFGWSVVPSCTLSGSRSPAPDVLHNVDVLIVNWNECARRYAQLKTLPGYENWPDITPGMHCTGDLDVGGRDACQGDSGGAVVHDNNVVYGINSWGFGCVNGTYPGVNAHVPFYNNWISLNALS